MSAAAGSCVTRVGRRDCGKGPRGSAGLPGGAGEARAENSRSPEAHSRAHAPLRPLTSLRAESARAARADHSPTTLTGLATCRAARPAEGDFCAAETQKDGPRPALFV